MWFAKFVSSHEKNKIGNSLAKNKCYYVYKPAVFKSSKQLNDLTSYLVRISVHCLWLPDYQLLHLLHLLAADDNHPTPLTPSLESYSVTL